MLLSALLGLFRRAASRRAEEPLASWHEEAWESSSEGAEDASDAEEAGAETDGLDGEEEEPPGALAAKLPEGAAAAGAGDGAPAAGATEAAEAAEAGDAAGGSAAAAEGCCAATSAPQSSPERATAAASAAPAARSGDRQQLAVVSTLIIGRFDTGPSGNLRPRHLLKRRAPPPPPPRPKRPRRQAAASGLTAAAEETAGTAAATSAVILVDGAHDPRPEQHCSGHSEPVKSPEDCQAPDTPSADSSSKASDSDASPARFPGLGQRECLEDAHLTAAIQLLLQPPGHVWVATPVQVVLLLAEQDRRDRHADRDGSLRSIWDNEHISVLVLPITSDLKAGRRADAGEHWSVLVARRGGGRVEAELLDSLGSTPAGTLHTAQRVLARLAKSGRWAKAPRRPQVRELRLQSDAYQCGCFCILLMQRVVAGERGQEFEVTPARAERLREGLCAAAGEGGLAAGGLVPGFAGA